MKSYEVLSGLILTTFFVCYYSQEVKPNFRILAPQFICDDDASKNVENLTNETSDAPKATTIRFHTASGQKLTFSWAVRFKILNGPRDQRFNLMVWRAVRNLEKKLGAISETIAESNMVAINNSMLVQGVDYVFNIIGTNNRGVQSDPRSFAIKFTDPKNQPKLDIDGGDPEEQISILMLGADAIYADSPYIVEAQITPCKPTNDYYFIWSVHGVDGVQNIDVSHQLGKRLTIPPETLIGGKEYDIGCRIMKLSEQKQITTNGIFIKILEKGASIDMNIEKLLVATRTPLNIIAFVKNPDNVQDSINYFWTCEIMPDKKPCENIKILNQNEINIEAGLPDEGEYVFRVSINIGDEKASNRAIIIAQNSMLPTIDIGTTSVLTVSGEELEIQARVSDLRSNCILYWTSVEEKGFTYLDKSLVPGGLGSDLSINSHEETFLSELVEFDNETFYREFPLKIAKASGDWKGLEPDVKYKFRLSVNCACSPTLECYGPKNITGFSDVVVITNKPPTLSKLKVNPSAGFALKTKFQISTTPALDSKEDYPITYTYGYKYGTGETVKIATFIENLAVETILPYSEADLIPYLTACDSRKGCSTEYGPPITTSKEITVSDDELEFYLDRFQKELFRKEYEYSFSIITMICQTLQALNADLAKSFLFKVESSIKNDIKKQMDEIRSANRFESFNEFIQASNVFIEKFTVSEDLIQEIIKLRDDVFEMINKNNTTVKEEVRIKRSLNRQKRDMTPEYLNNYITMSEYILMKNESQEKVQKEKENIVTTLEKSAMDFCKAKTYKSLDWKLLSMSVDSIVMKSNVGFASIPYHPKTSNKIGDNMLAKLQIISENNQSNYCALKIFYNINIMNEDNDDNRMSPIYYCTLLDKNQNIVSSFKVIIKIPIVKYVDQLECRKWNNMWDEKSCVTNENYIKDNGIFYVICKCDALGYFSLYKTQKALETTEASQELLNISTTTDPIDITTTSTISITITSTSSSCDFDDKYCVIKTNDTSDAVIGESKKETSSSALVISLSIGMIILIVLLIYLYYRYTHKKHSKKSTSESNNSDKYEAPIYRRLCDEYLMEGSMESLEKYKIIPESQ